MEEKTIIPVTSENALKKDNSMYKKYVDANQEKYSCFEETVFNNIEANMNRAIKVGVIARNGYKNIVKFNGLSNQDQINVPAERVKETSKIKPTSKDASIIAQCLTKCACEVATSRTTYEEFEQITERVYDSYKRLYKRLNEDE